MTVNEKFGTRLREIRKTAGFSLRELAEKVGVNFSYLSKIENGVLPPPSEKVIRRLARELDFDKDELLSLAGVIPADIAEILKDRRARERLRAEQAKKEGKASRRTSSLPRVSQPWKGLYRLALPVFLVLAVAFSIWFASPTQALQIQYPNQPAGGYLGGTYTFSVKVNIQDQEHLPLKSVDVVIYNVASPTTYKATLSAMPLGASSAAAHNPTEGSASGTATVTASADTTWGYSAGGTGYAYFGGTGYTFTPSTSGGYGYQGGTGTTSITYTIVWTSPSNWPTGSYKIRTTLTTSPQSPGGGTTFTQTSSTFTLSTVSSGGGGGGGGGASSGDTTYLTGIINQSGVFTQSVTARSADHKVKLEIAKNVTGENSNGQPLYVLRIAPVATPPSPPADSSIVGPVYDLGPNGATFSPDVTITFTYDPADLPAGVLEENLSLAYYDAATYSWSILEGVSVDTSSHTVSARISHFTNFAVIAGTRPASFTVSELSVSPATMDPGDTATVTATISNGGDVSGSFDAVLRINDNIVETRKITLSGRSSEEVSFTVAPEVAGSYEISIDGLSTTLKVAAPAPDTSTTTTAAPPPVTSTTLSPTTTTTPVPAPVSTTPTTTTTSMPVPTPRPGVNWLLIAGIIAVVVIVAGIVTWQIKYRRGY